MMKMRICLLFVFLTSLFCAVYAVAEDSNTATLLLVRHGQSGKNNVKLQGHRNPALITKGKLQARKLARYLRDLNEPFEAIYCSDLVRAKATAEILASTFHCEVIADRALRSKRRKSQNYEPETTDQVLARATAYLTKIAQEHVGETIIVVTHASLISLLMLHLDTEKEINPKANSLANCSIVEFDYDPNASIRPFTLASLYYPKSGKIIHPITK